MFRNHEMPRHLVRNVCILFYKPYDVLSQFQQNASQRPNLAKFNFPKSVYPVGRLDADSEGLLLLSDESRLIDRVLSPKYRHSKTYWAQIEGIPTFDKLKLFETGLQLKEYRALPAYAKLLDPKPQITPRDPPIRFRKSIPDSWVQIIMYEGKNRQVRKMTASIGHGTLRLIRMKIGIVGLGNLQPGEWRELNEKEKADLLIDDAKSLS